MGTLKNLVIAVTGTLAHDNSQLKKWIEANGGRYTPRVHKGITHLIAGEDAWRNSSDAVQSALSLGAFVVSYDWLEDSLQKRRKLAETKYTWEHKWQERRQRKKLKRLGLLADAKKFNDGCEEVKRATGSGTSKFRSKVVVRKPKLSKSFFFADVVETKFVSAAEDLKRRREEREMKKAKRAEEEAAKKEKETEKANANRATSSATTSTSAASSASLSSHAFSTSSFPSSPPTPGSQAKKTSLKDLYHYYLDSTGFEYKITLTRCNLRLNQITRYRLSILESHTKPNVYATLVEYFPPGAGGTSTKAKGNEEDAYIQALLDFSNTFPEDGGVATGSASNGEDDDDDDAPQPAFPSQHQANTPHPEAARLSSLLTPPPPSPTKPFKDLLAPLNSPFPTAWRAFRHTFRDLTLLTWEERFDVTKSLYKTRASRLGIEPFVYVRPKNGLPLGLRVQESGLGIFQNPPPLVRTKEGDIVTGSAGSSKSSSAFSVTQTSSSTYSPRRRDTYPPHDDDPSYRYNASRLPSLTHPLGDGIIGTALSRDADAARKNAEAARRAVLQAEDARMVGIGKNEIGEKKPNFSRPLFNGVMGRPVVDAWGRWKRGVGVRGNGAGRGGGVVQGAVGVGVVKRASRPFPSERRGL